MSSEDEDERRLHQDKCLMGILTGWFSTIQPQLVGRHLNPLVKKFNVILGRQAAEHKMKRKRDLLSNTLILANKNSANYIFLTFWGY